MKPGHPSSIQVLCLCLLLPAAIVLSRAQTATAPVAEPAVEVTAAEPTSRRIQFNPHRPPPDMPPLRGGEAALTQYAFDCDVRLKYEITGRRAAPEGVEVTAEIRRVTVKLTLESRIYLPYNTSRQLREHEEGHREINDRVYRDAQAVAREEAEKLLPRRWTGRGATEDDAGQAATDAAVKALCHAYLERVAGKASRVGDLYDEITDHGRKPRPAVADAIRMSLQRWEQEQQEQQEQQRRP